MNSKAKSNNLHKINKHVVKFLAPSAEKGVFSFLFILLYSVFQVPSGGHLSLKGSERQQIERGN